MKRALVIDDENRTRDLIAKMINSFELDIEAIPAGENVKSGIEAIKEHNPDLVFLDIQMPDGTGFDVLNALPKKDFEIIFITCIIYRYIIIFFRLFIFIIYFIYFIYIFQNRYLNLYL